MIKNNTGVVVPESAILLSCGKCHGDDLPLVFVSGNCDNWSAFFCLSCFKEWNKQFGLEVVR